MKVTPSIPERVAIVGPRYFAHRGAVYFRTAGGVTQCVATVETTHNAEFVADALNRKCEFSEVTDDRQV